MAQATYPSKPIRLVVPFPPGGASDLTARTLAQKMGESMGQSIVVDNKPGANGAIGIDLVAKSPPDGYTILLTDRGSLAVNPSLYAKLPYDPLKDFSYIGIATDGPYVLVVNPKLNVKTVAGARRAGERRSRARSTTRASASAAWRSSISKRSTARWASTCCTCRTRVRRRRRRRWSRARSA